MTLPSHSFQFAIAPTLLACAALLATVPAFAQAQPTSASAEWAPGRVIVMTRAGLKASELARVLQPHGGVARRLGRSDLHVVQLPPQMSEVAVQQMLARHPLLRFAELDRKVLPAVAVNDPYAGSQWHLSTTRTDMAWGSATGTGVTIAILDSGIDPSHADLQSSLVAGYNSSDGSSVTTDNTGHGTSVAGVAGAAMNNGVGVAGVAGKARIMPIRITDASGTAYYSTIASGIVYAADQGVRVANCSYGYLFKNASVQSAANYLKSKGGLLVVSAGNNGADEAAADTSAMITVSATDSADRLTSWSSYGQMVDLAAPGAGIWSTLNGGGYGAVNGTSYSSPLVAGVVALMMSANPALAPAQVESLLFSTATDLGAAGKDIYYGHGRVDAEAAVRAAAQAVAVDAQAPSTTVLNPAAGSAVSGTVSVDAEATDNIGVTRVDLLVNGRVVASDSVAPYRFAWDSTGTANGSANVSTKAYDAAGNVGSSANVAVTVSNLASDVVAPTVAFTSPANGATVSGTASITAKADDNAGPAGLVQQLSIDGKVVASTTGAKLSYKWNTRKVAAGWHTLSVTATDQAGNATTTTIQVRR